MQDICKAKNSTLMDLISFKKIMITYFFTIISGENSQYVKSKRSPPIITSLLFVCFFNRSFKKKSKLTYHYFRTRN